MYSVLAQSPIFKGLSETELQRIFETLTYQERRFAPEEMMISAGESTLCLYILVEGQVRGETVNPAGKTIRIEDIYAPDTFATTFLFSSKKKLMVDIVASTDCRILLIYKPELMRLFKEHPIILENFLQIISDKFVLLLKKLKFLTQKTIIEKLSSFLLTKYEETSQTSFKLEKTQQELADYFGVTRPAVARTLGELENSGIIKSSGRKIEILSLIKLRQNGGEQA